MPCSCARVSTADLGLSYDDPDAFCRPQWRWLPFGLFAMYRVIVATYFFGIFLAFFIVSMAKGLGGDFFAFFTCWGLILVTAYLFVAATGTLYQYIIYRRAPPTDISTTDDETPDETSPLTESGIARRLETPWYFKLSWLLFNISAVVALIVTLVYWPALSDYAVDIPFVIDFNVHALNSIVIVLELMFSSMPIRYLHALYVLLVGAVYVLLTVILYYSGWTNHYDNQPYVYPFLDYAEKPSLAALIIMAIVAAAFLLQLILWGIFKLKLRLSGARRSAIGSLAAAQSSSYNASTEKEDGVVEAVDQPDPKEGSRQPPP